LQRKEELRSIQTSIQEYRTHVSELEQKGQASLTKPARHLMGVYVEPVAKGLVEWVMECRHSPGRNSSALPIIESFDGESAAFCALKVILDRIYRKPTVQTVCKAIGRSIELEMKLQAFEEQNAPLYKTIAKHVKQSPYGYRPEYRRKVFSHAANRYKILWQDWDNDTLARVGSAVLDVVVAKTGLCQVHTVGHYRRRRTIVSPTPEFEKWMQDKHAVCELLHPRERPMLCPPVPYGDTGRGGGVTPTYQSSLVLRATKKGVFDDAPAPTQPATTRAVNALQAVPWVVHSPVLDVATHLWEKAGWLPGVAHRDDLPLPAKPGDIATNRLSRNEYKAKAREVWKANETSRSRRVTAKMTLSLAAWFRPKGRIWFKYRADFRGRLYARAPYLNPQGTDLEKSLLRFAEYVPLGKDGLRWLKIHAANCYGVDKVSNEDRVAWAEANIEKMRASAKDPLGDLWWTSADKGNTAFQFLSACQELCAAMDSPDPTAFKSNLPVTVDGSCNGIQHLAAISRDATSGALVNLVPGTRPGDIYSVVATECLRIVDELIAGKNPERYVVKRTLTAEDVVLFAGQWKTFGVTRGLTKRPTMIVPYGGTVMAFERYIDDYITEQLMSGGSHPFGSRKSAAVVLMARIVNDAINEVVKLPREIMAWTKEVAKVRTVARLPIQWGTPSGFVVRQAYKKQVGRIVRLRVGDKSRLLSFTDGESDVLDGRKQAQSLAPNWIHSMDAAALVLTVCRMLDWGVTDLMAIHDSYGAHAGNMQMLASATREVFAGIYKTDQLAVFVECVSEGMREGIPHAPKRGTLNTDDVLYSPYFFH